MFDHPENLLIPLPEDVLRAKHAGEFELCLRLIDRKLASPRTSEMLKARLEYEKQTLPRLIKRYPYDREKALELAKKRISGFTEEELDEAELEGQVDYIFVKGEKRYVTHFAGSLLKFHPEWKDRELAPSKKDSPDLDEFISGIKREKEIAYRFSVTSSLKVEDAAFEPGETYTVHIPVPAPSAQQAAGDIAINADADGIIAPADACHRTVCYKRTLDKNAPFDVSFTYTSRLRYVRPFEDVPHVVYPDVPAPVNEDLEQQYPHIVFTPYLTNLARQIAGNETRPLYLARRVYDYITTHVRYSFMRSYSLIENHSQYAAVNYKGDCGIQAVLFITLCRILGIPARWQSGLTIGYGTTGNHDWAMFYTREFGWLFADASFGGGARRSGRQERWNYYFGNLDPFRMVANRAYYKDFDPPKHFLRYDPCDSQDGEVETTKRGLDNLEYDKTDTVTEFIKL
ncbi:MAG: transglutaminase domain-containing protein [Clostridia bacterium]|nr:transglutaminase domain-containing protein [Clostridia bacterium]